MVSLRHLVKLKLLATAKIRSQVNLRNPMILKDAKDCLSDDLRRPQPIPSLTIKVMSRSRSEPRHEPVVEQARHGFSGNSFLWLARKVG